MQLSLIQVLKLTGYCLLGVLLARLLGGRFGAPYRIVGFALGFLGGMILWRYFVFLINRQRK
jgi:hypothetical protein